MTDVRWCLQQLDLVQVSWRFFVCLRVRVGVLGEVCECERCVC